MHQGYKAGSCQNIRQKRRAICSHDGFHKNKTSIFFTSLCPHSGSRCQGKSVKEAHVGFIPFNIIPSCESYDC